MLGERIASQSELVRAIVSGYSPCCGVHTCRDALGLPESFRSTPASNPPDEDSDDDSDDDSSDDGSSDEEQKAEEKEESDTSNRRVVLRLE